MVRDRSRSHHSTGTYTSSHSYDRSGGAASGATGTTGASGGGGGGGTRGGHGHYHQHYQQQQQQQHYSNHNSYGHNNQQQWSGAGGGQSRSGRAFNGATSLYGSYRSGASRSSGVGGGSVRGSRAVSSSASSVIALTAPRRFAWGVKRAAYFLAFLSIVLWAFEVIQLSDVEISGTDAGQTSSYFIGLPLLLADLTMIFFVARAASSALSSHGWQSNFVVFLGDSFVLGCLIFLLIYAGMNGMQAVRYSLDTSNWVDVSHLVLYYLRTVLVVLLALLVRVGFRAAWRRAKDRDPLLPRRGRGRGRSIRGSSVHGGSQASGGRSRSGSHVSAVSGGDGGDVVSGVDQRERSSSSSDAAALQASTAAYARRPPRWAGGMICSVLILFICWGSLDISWFMWSELRISTDTLLRTLIPLWLIDLFALFYMVKGAAAWDRWPALCTPIDRVVVKQDNETMHATHVGEAWDHGFGSAVAGGSGGSSAAYSPGGAT